MPTQEREKRCRKAPCQRVLTMHESHCSSQWLGRKFWIITDQPLEAYWGLYERLIIMGIPVIRDTTLWDLPLGTLSWQNDKEKFSQDSCSSWRGILLKYVKYSAFNKVSLTELTGGSCGLLGFDQSKWTRTLGVPHLGWPDILSHLEEE